jgi:glycine dehydrogenase
MAESATFDLGAFGSRHIGVDSDARAVMLSALGYDSVDALLAAAVPASIAVDTFRAPGASILPPAATEREALRELRALANRNTVNASLIGLGYYDTITPAVIKRNVLENPSWYTAYTPYQPEISQGRLEALLNFQTMVCDLTGLVTANASMLDEGTAVVEAMLLARRASKAKSNRFLVDRDTLPQTKALLVNRAEAVGIELVEYTVPVTTAGEDTTAGADTAAELPELADGAFGILVQYPGASGRIADPSAVLAAAKAQGALAVAAADLLALTLLTSPGELGADIAAGTTQRFGVPMGFGGPHAGYLAVRAGLERQLPGRLVGVSQDADGRPAYRLSLQTREQHIRREKATSNICTAQALNALGGVVYLSWLGRRGIVELGELLVQRTHYARERLVALDGVEALHEQPVVREFAVRLAAPVDAVLTRCAEQGVAAGVPLGRLGLEEDGLLVAITERRSREDIDRLADVLGAAVAAEREAAGVPA